MLANVTGVLGVIANITIYQQNKGRKLLVFKLISDVLWTMHYFFLSAYSGAAVGGIGVFRELVFYSQTKRKTKSKLWLAVFVLISIISAILTWKGFFSILPTAASVMSVVSFWNNKPSLTRHLALPISASMLTYDIICNSYMGIVNEIFTLISVVTAIVRSIAYERDTKNE